MIDRRQILSAAALLGTGVCEPAHAADQPAPSVEARLTRRALEHLHPITVSSEGFGGPGWELMAREGRAAEFFMLGEEHGTHEIPVMAKALFQALRPAGYDTLAIEISPPIAADLDQAARSGVTGIEAYCRSNWPGPAFYFWRTEAELVAAVRAAAPKSHDALWGLDYEVTGDRRLIAMLRAKAPASAKAALNALDKASADAWSAWRTTHNPGALFTFSGDPALVRAVRAAWPSPDAGSALVLTTLEETLEINRLFPTHGYQSNVRRAALNRANLVAHLDHAAPRRPKVMFKMGETHVMRGLTTTAEFDVGSLAYEVAALRGGHAFGVLVGGGRGSRHGQIDPTVMRTAEAPVDMLDDFLGLGFLTAAVDRPGPNLIDLRPLRDILLNTARLKAFNNPEAARVIFAYDALVIWNGTTPAEMLIRP